MLFFNYSTRRMEKNRSIRAKDMYRCVPDRSILESLGSGSLVGKLCLGAVGGRYLFWVSARRAEPCVDSHGQSEKLGCNHSATS
jgi:hypothetical protein